MILSTDADGREGCVIFSEAERSEQIIELIIASTPHEAFQKHLLDQEVGYDIDTVLNEGGKYEAMVIGKQAI